MGTSMSAYVELDYDRRSQPFTDPTQVFSLTNGSFALDKGYQVFDGLAGGRNSAMSLEDQDPASVPLIVPRGMPTQDSLHRNDGAFSCNESVSRNICPFGDYVWRLEFVA